MKKINSIKQLQIEKNRIIQRQEELENKIRGNWKELKESLKPARIIKNSFIEAIIDRKEKELNGESALKKSFIYGTSMLAKKFTNKVVQKAGQFFKKR